MIRVTDTGSTLTVQGHANDRKHPRSEESMQACASITALVQALLYGIWDLGGDAPKHVIEPGGCFYFGCPSRIDWIPRMCTSEQGGLEQNEIERIRTYLYEAVV